MLRRHVASSTERIDSQLAKVAGERVSSRAIVRMHAEWCWMRYEAYLYQATYQMALVTTSSLRGLCIPNFECAWPRFSIASGLGFPTGKGMQLYKTAAAIVRPFHIKLSAELRRNL